MTPEPVQIQPAISENQQKAGPIRRLDAAPQAPNTENPTEIPALTRFSATCQLFGPNI